MEYSRAGFCCCFVLGFGFFLSLFLFSDVVVVALAGLELTEVQLPPQSWK